MKYVLQIMALALVCNCFAACSKKEEKNEHMKHEKQAQPKKS